MAGSELSNEIDRLKQEFSKADEGKIRLMESLIEQAAHERIFLKKLNQQALDSGLVKFHPDNPKLQQVLPISGQIAKHSATLTNIMDKLMKHLAIETDDDDDELGEYE